MPKSKKFRQFLMEFRVAKPGYLEKVTRVDKILDKTILKLIPEWVMPNFLTTFRYWTIPFLIFFLVQGFIVTAAILFVVSALSDMLDGAMARTRKQITEWGIVNDPIADKLLIGTVAAFIVSKHISVYLAFAVIGLEVVIALIMFYQARKKGGRIVPAKIVGKIKMIFQSIGVAMAFVFALTMVPALYWISVTTLVIGVIFALLSIFVYKSI